MQNNDRDSCYIFTYVAPVVSSRIELAFDWWRGEGSEGSEMSKSGVQVSQLSGKWEWKVGVAICDSGKWDR